MITATATIVAVVLSNRGTKGKLAALNEGQKEIHVLVNARLTEALDRIDEQDQKIEKLEGQLKLAQRKKGAR